MKNILLLILLVVGLILGSAGTAFSEAELFFFPKNIHYNIYVQGMDDAIAIIKSVEILETQQIFEEIFLVVRSPGGLKLSKQEGFIRVSSIIAIIPEQTFSIQSTSKSGGH